MSGQRFLFAAILAACLPTSAHAHGRMLRPPSRMSGYLAGLPMPVNYNDHEMNCGGRQIEWDQSGGKCGICGEPWPATKNYERPKGIMVQHQIRTATYQENQIITIRLQITVAHRGWHEFRICNVARSGGIEATQDCLDQTLLADENGQTRFYNGTTTIGFFEFPLVLPAGLTCDLCVIQWKWKCGNDWGCGENGVCCVGCGDRQEEFYACSDVTINPRNSRYTTAATTQRTIGTTPTTPRVTWRYPYTTTTQRTIRTTPSTPRTTWRYPYTTTTTTARPSYNYKFLYEYFKRYPNVIPPGTSIKFHGSGSSNNNQYYSRSAQDEFLSAILGRDGIIINRDGLSVPLPSVNNNNNSPVIANDTDMSNYLVKDRFCAVCQYDCLVHGCSWYCPATHIYC